jgi:hypothetical protein
MTDINPFSVLQVPYKAAARVHPVVVSFVFGAMSVVLIVAVTALEGNLGRLSDVQVTEDVRRIVNGSHIQGPQDFPVLRDIASWALATIAFTTLGLIWHQWQTFGRCISQLRENQVLYERAQPTFSRVHRMVRYDRTSAPNDHPLEGFLERVDRAFRVASYFSVVVALSSVVLVMILVRSYESLGVFRLWNVDGSGLSDAEFARGAYDGWWASSSHLGGYLVYIGISVVFVFGILMQNVVGAIAVYTIGGLPAFCEFRADWFNRDGNFGWRPIGEAFRTVRWSLLLHGLALTVVFAMVGAGVWAYTVPLLMLWLLVIPFYLGVPALVCRQVTRQVKDDALAQVARTGPVDLVSASLVVPYIRRAPVRPLRVSQFGVYAFSASVLLPIVLTVAQIAGT